jgi:hypothetical protein
MGGSSETMRRPTGKCGLRVGTLLALLFVASAASAREKKEKPPFQYAGGTEQIQRHAGDKLEVSSQGLVFKGSAVSLDIPFSTITSMEYRPDVNKQVRNLKLPWKVRPGRGGGHENRFFTIVYKQQGQTHVVVLRVEPLVMRPYLAEIELKSGKRVQVFGYEEY